MQKALFAALLAVPLASPAAALTCRITGDSIGVQIANTKVLAPYCQSAGSVLGAKDTAWVLQHTSPSQVTIFVTGSNDNRKWNDPVLRQQLANKARTMANLEAMRRASQCKICLWVTPLLREPHQAVLQVAFNHGDRVVTFEDSTDGVHPRNPRAVANAILARLPELRGGK
jgi:hypothetical protein